MPRTHTSVAIEIYANPYDINAAINPKGESPKYDLAICRGVLENCKPLVVTARIFGTVAEAAMEAAHTLEAVIDQIEADLKDERSLARTFVRTCGYSLDPTKVLSRDLIARLVVDLRNHRVANTRNYRKLVTTDSATAATA